MFLIMENHNFMIIYVVNNFIAVVTSTIDDLTIFLHLKKIAEKSDKYTEYIQILTDKCCYLFFQYKLAYYSYLYVSNICLEN